MKTAIAKGAGAWGVINARYRRYALQLSFPIDACQRRHLQGKGKGKVERQLHETADPHREVFDNLGALQTVTDAWLAERAGRLCCPATCTTIAEDRAPGGGY